jgi:hypothetical protein
VRGRDERRDVGDQLLKLFRGIVTRPSSQLDRLYQTKAERRAHIVDQDRDENPSPQAVLGLLPHPVRGDRVVRPHHHDAPRAGESFGDLQVEGLARLDLAIPPD